MPTSENPTLPWPVVDAYAGGATSGGTASWLKVRLGDGPETTEFIRADLAQRPAAPDTEAAPRAVAGQGAGEVDMQHPKIQSLLSQQARKSIEARMIGEVLDAATLDALDDVFSNDYETELFDRVKELKRAFLAAQPSPSAESAAPRCACGDRPAAQCDEEWGPNCDLGNNEKHVRVSTVDPALVDAALAAPRCPAVDAGTETVVSAVAFQVVASELNLAHTEIERLRAALAGPAVAVEAEPVASVSRSTDMEGWVQWAGARIPVGTLLYAAPPPQPAAVQPPQVAREPIEEMVDRFLSWKLPPDFAPDGGITFKRVYNETSPFGPQNHEPIGTNLLTADQARAMLAYVLGITTPTAPKELP